MKHDFFKTPTSTFKNLTEIMHTLSNTEFDASNHNEKLLIEVVRFLLPRFIKDEVKKLKISDPFKLASLFRGTDDTRFYLNEIYSNGSQLIASNGHVLILIDHPVPAGYYTDLGLMTQTAARYPDIIGALAKAKHGEPLPLASGERYTVSAKREGMRYTLSTCTTMEFDLDYVNLIKKIGADPEVRITDWGLYFEGPNYKGMIAPLRK